MMEGPKFGKKGQFLTCAAACAENNLLQGPIPEEEVQRVRCATTVLERELRFAQS